MAASVLTAHGVRLGQVRTQVQQQTERPRESDPRAAARLVIDRIKELVEALGLMVADAPAAGKLVGEIKTALDALSRGQGIR